MASSSDLDRSIFRCYLQHLIIGIVACVFCLVLFIAGLYLWATTVNTCQSRKRYSVLTFLEETIPVVTRPIQQKICP